MAFNDEGLHYFATFSLSLHGFSRKVFETPLDTAWNLAKAPEKNNHYI